MPTKTSVGPKEVVRLEVLRLTPSLRGHFASRRERKGPGLQHKQSSTGRVEE
jgi:hypothetical protein